MKQRCYLLLFIAFTNAGGCKKETNSQPKPGDNSMIWQVYNTTNSVLPNNQVNSIAIDKNDVKWIGTADGLVRLTGSAWTAFNSGNSPLPSTYITALAVEGNGSVWIGTSKGMAKFDGSNWQVYTAANSVMTSNKIMCMAYDTMRKKIWIATEKELISVDNDNAWKRFDTIEDDLILSMAADQDGALWLGTFYQFAFRGSIRKFNDNKWTTYHLDLMGYTSTFPYSLAIDKSNSVYATLTGTSVRAVIRYRGGNWREVSGPECAMRIKVILAENDKIWVGGNTLSQFDDAQTTCLSIPGGASNIQAMALDKTGRKWLGTIDRGVAIYAD